MQTAKPAAARLFASSGSAVCQQRLGCLPAAARLFASSGSAVCQERLGCLPAAARLIVEQRLGCLFLTW